MVKVVEGMGRNRMARVVALDVTVIPLTEDGDHQCGQRKKLELEEYI